MARISDKLIADIKNAEGCNLTAYKDTLGFWTVGYGHLLIPHTSNWAGFTITAEKAEWYLIMDLSEADQDAETLGEWTNLDTECRQNAVVELVFNIGLLKWKDFHNTRAAILAHNWQKAHDELLNSVWAAQVGTHRSQRLAGYLLNGTYP